MKYWMAIVASLLLPTRVPAQSDCVTLPRAEAVLNSIARYFLDDDLQAVREGWLDKVDSAAPRLILSDNHKCQQVMRAVTSELRKAGDWEAFRTTGYQFAVYQIGTYYAAIIQQLDSSGQTRLTRVPLLVFRMSDVHYVGNIGV